MKVLRNNINKVTFFRELNDPYRNKVWGEFKEEYNEIWWHAPTNGSTECNHTYIYNIETDQWFDTAFTRSAGTTVGLYPYPLAADSTAILNQYHPDPIVFALANNPLRTTINSNIVIVNIPSNTILITGMLVTIAGATAFNGLTEIQLNLSRGSIRS